VLESPATIQPRSCLSVCRNKYPAVYHRRLIIDRSSVNNARHIYINKHQVDNKTFQRVSEW